MNRAAAKFILGAYRPDGRDACHPQFREALAQVKADPELANWFAAEQAFDAGISAKLRAVSVPPDLRWQLLAGQKFSSRPRGWRRVRALGLAAALVVLLAIVGMMM